MTNKKDDKENVRNLRLAAVQAVHLVSLVLNEAYIIASAAKESGNPWKYLSNVKKSFSDLSNQNLTFTITTKYGENKQKSPVVTSTPLKGQGDEELEANNEHIHRSTSMFINNLFDMSDVDGTQEFVEDIQEPNNSYIEDVNIIIDSCIQNAVGKCVASESVIDVKESYSSNAFSSEFIEDGTFSRDDRMTVYTDKKKETAIKDAGICRKLNENIETENYINDIRSYESTYLTLNRDNEQRREEDTILQNVKMLSIHEIILRPDQSSYDNLSHLEYTTKSVEFPTSKASSTSTGRKNTLIRRCRLRSKRFFTCLRTWLWRRKLTGKLKVYQVHESPARSSHWKFNTISEAFLHSSLWKEIGFKPISRKPN